MIVIGVDCHPDLIGSEMLDGISLSSITVEARYHELLRKPIRHDLFRKRGIRDLRDGRSRPTAGLRLVFIDPLPDHLHQILNARSLHGSLWLALIRALLMAWGCGVMTPSTTPNASGVCRARP